MKINGFIGWVKIWGFCGVLLYGIASAGRFSFYSDTKHEKRKQTPLLLSAKTGNYNQKKGIFTAHGTVSLRQEGSLVCADHLCYEEATERLFVWGNVFIRTAEGEILFCDRAFLTRDLQEGWMTEVRILSRFRDRITALRVEKKRDHTQLAEMGSYTPCETCKDRLAPLWSLHARHILHEEDKNKIHCTDAHLEFMGIPVFYLPYFYLPTKRTSGLLFPHVSNSKELGLYLGMPYYWALNDHKDVTVTPFFMTRGGLMLAQEYRQRFQQGSVVLRGAVNTSFVTKRRWQTHNETSTSLRGYGYGNFSYDGNANWRLRCQEWWVSDKTFLVTRPFFGERNSSYLESKMILEGFYPHHYVQVRGLRYQGLQERDHWKTTPFIYPEIRYTYESSPTQNSHLFLFHLHTLSLYKKVGNAMQRGVIEGEWQWPVHTDWGQQWLFFARSQTSLYYSKIQAERIHSPQTVYTVGRCFPQGGIECRWPLMSGFTPTLQLLASPTHLNTPKVPNEDSQSLAFDDANLWSRSRYAGVDRVDDGTRANYGLEWSGPFVHQSEVSFFMGQSFSFSQPDLLLLPMGIRKGFSDWVGKVEAKMPHGRVLYRFRFDGHHKVMNFQAAEWSVGPPIATVSGSYAFSRRPQTLHCIPFCNQLFLAFSSKFTNTWSGKIFVTQDCARMASQPKILDKGLGVAYKDECFSAGITVQHSYYHMRDLRPGYTIDFYVMLKNLGGLHQKQDRFSRVP